MGQVSISKDVGGIVQISGDVRELGVVTIRPEHTLVLRCRGRIGPDQAEQLTAMLKRYFPENRCLVLFSDVELEVLEAKA